VIAEFLESHRNVPFPAGVRELELADVDLESLNVAVVGLADSYLGRGRLAPEQGAALETYVADLRRVVPELPEGTREYFARLHALAVAVLHKLPARGPAA
jgi:hypothetical protein